MANRTCIIEGCPNPHRARGWCSTHYKRWQVHGDPLVVMTWAGRPFVAECSVDGCSGPVEGRGWCRTHYMRWRDNGDPLSVQRKRIRKGDDPVAHFWDRVAVGEPDGCWPWLAGSHRTGRGYLQWNGAFVAAAWVALELDGRPVTGRMWALHHCDNPPCVNPAHLYVGTPSDNARDRYEHGALSQSATVQCLT